VLQKRQTSARERYIVALRKHHQRPSDARAAEDAVTASEAAGVAPEVVEADLAFLTEAASLATLASDLPALRAKRDSLLRKVSEKQAELARVTAPIEQAINEA